MRLNPRLSFKAKVTIPVVGVIFLLVATTMWLVNRRIADQLEAEVARTLWTCDAVFQNSQKIHARNLLARYSNVPNDSRFKAVSQLAEPKTMQFLLTELLAELGGDMMTFTTDQGKLLTSAKRDRLMNLEEFELRSGVAVKRALDGVPSTDKVFVSDRLFDVISVPVSVSGVIVGALTIGMAIDDASAQEFRQLTRSDIVLVADNRVVASTLQRRGFDEQFATLLNARSSTRQARGVRELGQIQPLVLPEEHYLCLIGRLGSLSRGQKLGYVLLTSNEAPLRALRETQQTLVLVGLVGALLSAVMVWALIRKITQPLGQLRDGADAVGRGDFTRRVEVASKDECGELAQAFNTMTENLKTSREELEQTVATLKTTKAQLTQSEKLSAVGEFVAGVAHELNNPLTSVIGFSQLLQRSGVPDNQRGYLARIVGESQRCHKIVQSLLSFARQHPAERKVVCPNELVEAAMDILRYQLRTSNIEVITHLDPASPRILADPHQIQQVFVNIINNARQAIESVRPQGWLRITTAAFDDHVRILFQDNGPGISEENLARIFNPFFTTKEVGKGTGLGLSLCYGIINEHGGTIIVRSKPGEGATFLIDLPTTDEPEAAKAPGKSENSTRAALEGSGKRVLIVDDEDGLRDLIHEVLTADHYQVDAVGDAETALHKVGKNQYDLIVSDFKMPGLSGPQFYERLLAINPGAASRLIFMTGDVAGEQTRQFLQRHSKLCVSKPFTLDEFRATVSKLTHAEQNAPN